MLSQMKLLLQVMSFKSILLEVPGKLIRGAKDECRGVLQTVSFRDWPD